MNSKRGRPRKSNGQAKGKLLQIRLSDAEKQAFCEAAELDGKKVSEWVRDRLRRLARQELEGAGQPVAFMNKSNKHADPASHPSTPFLPSDQERLANVRFVRPSSIELTFADGHCSRLAVERLGLPAGRIRWSSVSASPTGETMLVTGSGGEQIPIDSTTLRYLVDKSYAQKVDAALASQQLSRAELHEMARDSPPPPEWFAQPARDLTRKSWK